MHNFVVYKSSAGSGKTFTLVKEYLRLSLYDEKKLLSNYKKILAITFTNKAAAEMKQRVIDALEMIAHGDEPSFIGLLICDEIKTSYEELKRRANIVLSNILHHYSDFSIGTIDSFTHKIVKTFAHDLKLPVNFNIELDTPGFYDKVISSLFNKIGEDPYVSALLKEYALTRAEDNSSWDPENNIRDFSRLLLKENSNFYIEQLKKFNAEELENFRKQFQEFVRDYKKQLKDLSAKALKIISDHGLGDEDFIYKKNGPQGFFKKCFNHTVTLADISGARIVEAVENNKWAGSSGTNMKEIIPSLNEIAVSLREFIRSNYSYYCLCELLSRQMYPLMLLKKIEEISEEQKQEERLVFISEFNQKIFEIINHEPTPFIYERLGERYQHYLIDEFQDTSSLQWLNILPLLDNSLSNGWFNLIVGDGKQSIYRWRNANVKQFAALPMIDNPHDNPLIAERGDSLKRNFAEKLLNTNYRSLKTIIEFNNALFSSLSGTLLTDFNKTIYKDQEQLIKNQVTGYITINNQKVERDCLDEETCGLIKSHILNSIKGSFQYKDICILVRTNGQGNTIANYLVTHDIPIVSSDSLLLSNNLEINTLLSFLRYLMNHQDIISAAAVINYLYQSRQINQATFHTSILSLSKNRSLFEVLKKCGIELSEDALSLNNIFDTCIMIVNALQLNKLGFHYIRFFLDEINEFLVLKNSSVDAFFEWWSGRTGKASMIIPENTNAVRIMTIHASKGLEFPVVIVPYCNWGIYRAGDTWVNVNNEKISLPVGVVSLSKKAGESGFEQELIAEQQEQLLDNLNLLYVAFTRAVERLHIISTSADTNHTRNVGEWLEDFLSKTHKPTAPGFYELGSPSPKFKETTLSPIENFTIEPLRFETDPSTIRIKSSFMLNSEGEAAKQNGVLIHWLLSKIKTAGDIEKALQDGLTKGMLNEKQVMEIKPKLEALITHKDLTHYFRENILGKTEAELATPEGTILRPDKIIFSENETVLIDYKTGKENNQKYFKQLSEYERALRSMGYVNIKKLLVYIDEMNVLTVN
jgi:ATP-dependent exoDNAse (exonuclease V) beta subunit